MNRPLRIAMFVGSFPVVSETFIVRQITGLLALGHAVDIYADTRTDATSPVHPEVAKYRLLERTTFMDMPPETAPWEMPVWPLTGRTWPPGSATSVHNAVRIARALPKLARCLIRSPALTRQVLRRSEYGYQADSLSALYRLGNLSGRPGNYDVLHAHFGPVGNSFRFARALWRTPLVVSFHGYDFCTLPRKEGAGMYRQLFEAADAVTVNSDFTRSRLEQLGCPAARLTRLPVGLDLEQFPFQPRTRKAGGPVRILTVARLVEIKGHEHVIRAMARLRLQHPDVRYDIVGDGPLRKQLESLVQELRLKECVTLHGALTGETLHQLMRAAHIGVLASITVEGDQEGQGLFLQEAQACGLPVVATQHGALPEGLLPGQSGFLVSERNAEALAERLGWLIEQADTWAELGRAGRRFVEERYDIHRLNERLLDLYATVRAQFERATR